MFPITATLLAIACFMLMWPDRAADPEPTPPPTTEAGEIAGQVDPLESEQAAENEPELTWERGRFSPEKAFFHQMADLGVTPVQIQRIVDTLSPVFNFRKARPAHRWEVGFKEGELVRFTLRKSATEIYDLDGLNHEPSLATRDVRTVRHTRVIEGVIENNLFEALAPYPRPNRLAAKLARVYAWDIDFYKDLRKNDSFRVLVETIFAENDEGVLQFIDYGEIQAAHYLSGRSVYEAYQFEAEGIEDGYYDAKGNSLVRDFLRSPLKFQRVTSRFQNNRFHPILKKSRPHRGVDYGAPINTPVMAVASGQVLRAGRYGSAGIIVALNHSNKMYTEYFHLNKVADGVRRGAKVKQGQIIGYVGKTGYATAAHLHFGMKINGHYVDPMQQKYKPGKPIPDAHKKAFQETVAAYRARLNPRPGAMELWHCTELHDSPATRWR